MKLVFATQNKHKAAELQQLMPRHITVQTLQDIGCHDDIPETAETLLGNAQQKSHYVYEKFQVNCFADDTGLEIDALNGEPGVYSARYAGNQKDAEDNMNLVLTKLKDTKKRTARFRTVISLIINGEEKHFEGTVEGEITTEKSGQEGFGYDPIFKPNGYGITFSEMTVDEKNKISHRGIAVRKLIDYLSSLG
jgi:XTP/dITP diphosphohydrolase